VDSDVEVDAAELRGLARHFADEMVALVGAVIQGVARSPRPNWVRAI
jgi:hypothetical protein